MSSADPVENVATNTKQKENKYSKDEYQVCSGE